MTLDQLGAITLHESDNVNVWPFRGPTQSFLVLNKEHTVPTIDHASTPLRSPLRINVGLGMTPSSNPMDDSQLLRYSRHLLLPQIDAEGQSRLLSARVLVVGLGGLGSACAMYLASAGVGTLYLNDFDVVDISNLQRQVIHNTPSVGLPKTESARSHLETLNPEIRYEVLEGRLNAEDLKDLASNIDLIVDCSDNFETRFLLNRVSVQQRLPLVSGAVIRFEGQLAVFNPVNSKSPCYNCLYPEDSSSDGSCGRNGVVAPLPGIVGAMQALEAIKLLAIPAYRPEGFLYLFDAMSMDWHRLRLERNPKCKTCGS